MGFRIDVKNTDVALSREFYIRCIIGFLQHLKRGLELSGYQFGGGTLGYPSGNAPGAVANRVALEVCVQARNEGRDLAREGNEIIREAGKWSPELAAACEVWKEIKFEFEAMDTL
ncbi:hypothetical protein NE237_029405 [Protea cynaroides]|uniref:Ribulose bisphosphate carboxylase large subunit C-terminal domain-containing protein n=1 Tax=Protea cynaroides TaxID=273540 RepID=A0A9Q0GRQ7_9MAGN|nr:hypothetical protein NE237_029405 [Protea cynaroides]